MKLCNLFSKKKEPTEADIFEKKIADTEKLIFMINHAINHKTGPIFFKSHSYSKEELKDNATIDTIKININEILSFVDKKLREGNSFYYNHFKGRIVNLGEGYAQLFIHINKRAPTKLELWKSRLDYFFGEQA